MPFTQADLDALDAARKQGARRVRFQAQFDADSALWTALGGSEGQCLCSPR
jgi:hypothetical protein